MIRIDDSSDLNWINLYRVAYQAELPASMLRARAVAIGAPFAKPVARAMLLIRLVNFLSGRSGVRSELCRYLVDRLNDDFTPWVPSLGHGMAADVQVCIDSPHTLSSSADKQMA